MSSGRFKNRYYRKLTGRRAILQGHGFAVEMTTTTRALLIYLMIKQCSPYQAVTGKIYRLKQQFLPPATS